MLCPEQWCGHNWTVVTELTAPELDSAGMVYDCGRLQPVRDILDHEVDHREAGLLLGDELACGDCETVAGRLAAWLGQRVGEQVRLPWPYTIRISESDQPWQAPGACWRWHAAHRLAGLPDGHKCARWHGHTYRGGVLWDQTTGSSEHSRRQAETVLGKIVHDHLDHTRLNDVIPVNPTSELVAEWLLDQATQQLGPAGIAGVWVAETPTMRATSWA